MLKPGIFEGATQAAAPKNLDAITERRLKLLRAPAGQDVSESTLQRQMGLPGSAVPNMNAGPTAQPAARSGAQMLTPSSIPDMYLSPEPIRQPAAKAPTPPVQPAPAVADKSRTIKKQVAAPVATPLPPAPMPPAVVGRYAIQQRFGRERPGIELPGRRYTARSKRRFEGPSFRGDFGSGGPGTVPTRGEGRRGLAQPDALPGSGCRARGRNGLPGHVVSRRHPATGLDQAATDLAATRRSRPCTAGSERLSTSRMGLGCFIAISSRRISSSMRATCR